MPDLSQNESKQALANTGAEITVTVTLLALGMQLLDDSGWIGSRIWRHVKISSKFEAVAPQNGRYRTVPRTTPLLLRKVLRNGSSLRDVAADTDAADGPHGLGMQ